ncbi:MAG: radical SAM protein [Candidatus Schekmanbacteria bacterium]|nr:radical SAM protein [Candidatus Schekmanbacteria bacterium]
MAACYQKLYESGELGERAEMLKSLLKSCTLCPHKCRVDRTRGDRGKCRAAISATISSVGPHFGEEPPLVGIHGSGTIFFTCCNLHCIFCQNYDISHLDNGTDVKADVLSSHMLNLQKEGCHNINLVTPTHFVPQIIEALEIAAARGLNLPIVYNCGGYESLDVIRLLDGIVDIYMPDAKFAEPKIAKELCGVADYFEILKPVLLEMHRQVGVLQINESGIAERGLLIRHLVMPGMLQDTRRILEFIAKNISPETYVNVMGQYRPCFEAENIGRISKSLDYYEYQEALKIAKSFGLVRGLEN